MSEHSPLPWRVEQRRDVDGDRYTTVVDAKGEPVPDHNGSGDCCACDVWALVSEADADLIVRAVNNHEKLVVVLRELIEAIDWRDCAADALRELAAGRNLLAELATNPTCQPAASSER